MAEEKQDEQTGKLFEKNSPGTQKKKLNPLTDYKEDYPNQQTNKLDTLTDYKGHGNVIQYQQTNRSKTNYNSNKKRGLWKRFKEDIKNNWVGYTIAGLRDWFIGSAGYYLINGFYANGTDSYTPPTQNATPIVSHLAAHSNTSSFGYAIVGVALFDFLLQTYRIHKAYKYNKGVDGKIERYKKDVDDKIKEYKEDVDDKINTYNKTIDDKIKEYKEDVDDKIKEYKESTDKNIEKLVQGIKHVNNRVKGIEKIEKYFLRGVKRINGSLDRVAIGLSKHFTEEQREQIADDLESKIDRGKKNEIQRDY